MSNLEVSTRPIDKPVTAPTIPVSEIFGPTLEGEGPWAGQPTYFLRVGGCDYKCVWCDTDQAVLPENVKRLPRLTQLGIITQLDNYVNAHPGPDLLAISGGNPGLYDLGVVVDWWHKSRSPSGWSRKVLVETQGSRWQDWFKDVNLLIVSPKPPSARQGNVLEKRLPPNAFEAFMSWAAEAEEYWIHRRLQVDLGLPLDRWQMIFKVVVFDEADYQFARDLHIRYPLIPFHLSTGTAMGGLSGQWKPSAQPLFREGHAVDWVKVPGPWIDDKEVLLERYRWLAERAMSDPVMADVKVQVQLHCLLWGITTKGV